MHAERGFPQQVGHLPYFIDRVDDEWKQPGPRPQEKPYFLFVGRLEVIKGLQTLIPLWPKDDGADLLIAGTGDYEAELRAQAAGNPSIKFLGSLPQKRLETETPRSRIRDPQRLHFGQTCGDRDAVDLKLVAVGMVIGIENPGRDRGQIFIDSTDPACVVDQLSR